MGDLIHIDKISLPADIKHVTRRRILDVFKSGERLAAMDVNVATGISKPTVMRTIQYYCEQGILESVGLGQASSVGGKKPEFFTFADKRKILCIAMWPGCITLSLSGIVGDVYAITGYCYHNDDSLADVLEYLSKISLEFLAGHDVGLESLYGVELSTSGTVDYKSNILRFNSQSPAWGTNIPLVEHLKPIFGDNVEYFMENAGRATGRALLIDHPEYTGNRIITIFSTWGVSACLIENGHVLSGKDSLIGEIGHMTISSIDTETCGCGKRGCLERLVSIERVRLMLGAEGISNLGDGEPISFKSLFEASARQHPSARRVVSYLAHCFSIALHNLSLVYNPDYVIFQGDFALADSYFNERLMSELSEFRYYPDNDIFATRYDSRDLALLASRGGAALLKRRYFAGLENR